MQDTMATHVRPGVVVDGHAETRNDGRRAAARQRHARCLAEVDDLDAQKARPHRKVGVRLGAAFRHRHRQRDLPNACVRLRTCVWW